MFRAARKLCACAHAGTDPPRCVGMMELNARSNQRVCLRTSAARLRLQTTIRACVEDMHSWLGADPENVVAVHCKAGKGRTGLIVSAYLVFAGLAPSTTAAIKMFGDVRTHDGKGITIPSQMRYVHYLEQSLKAPFPPAVYKLRHIRLHTIPNFDVTGGCDPYFEVRLGPGAKHVRFNWLKENGGKVRNYKPKHKVADMDLSKFNVRVKGDVKICFYDWDQFSAHDKMFHFWFNTGFIDNNYLLFHKEVLDRACKDKACAEFEPEFKVEVFLDKVEEVPDEFAFLDKPDAGAGAAAGGAGEAGDAEPADEDDDEEEADSAE